MSFSLDGTRIITGGGGATPRGEGGAKVWDARTGTRLKESFTESLDRLIAFSTETDEPDEVKKRRAERAKNPELAPPREKK